MNKKYSFQFREVEKKLYRKYRFLRGTYGAYEAQQALVELQKKLSGITKLTVFVQDMEELKEYEFQEVYIDPSASEIQLLDELQKQLLEAGEEIDGARIYTEINRQFNTEATQFPEMSSNVRSSKGLVAKLFPWLFKPTVVDSKDAPYNQPIFPPKEIMDEVVDQSEEPVLSVYDYEMIFTKVDGVQISCEFQSGEQNETRNSALKKYFPIEGNYLIVDDEKILASELKSIRLEKIEPVDIFSLPEEGNILENLSELPE
ncbi:MULTISPECIES: hypothetical protein [unclassified Enterococcus]|uniref:hypothetical protein n=1 Tax=unclassified Enterococcus TaxID=2608891 RepID=UPI0003548C11|nr:MULTISPECIES: hypothetical protein [unclassified Enterococcus]EPH93269.1 hypothetical protein D922_01810 [Enterococcus faecalis 06-MB-DW-09]MBO0424485.1 hypothetical protein [Enterococcus faecium]OTO34085.1 hypothetical protein A5870_001436 [Enterococcus sp. 2G9_DIV0600]OTO38669.1 hypothetical protein A5871_003255 [Enterococcus sp. 2F9_DIV0599]